MDTGAIDDLTGIAALCRAEGVWFHVDGAAAGVRDVQALVDAVSAYA